MDYEPNGTLEFDSQIGWPQHIRNFESVHSVRAGTQQLLIGVAPSFPAVDHIWDLDVFAPRSSGGNLSSRGTKIVRAARP